MSSESKGWLRRASNKCRASVARFLYSCRGHSGSHIDGPHDGSLEKMGESIRERKCNSLLEISICIHRRSQPSGANRLTPQVGFDCFSSIG